MCELVHTRQLLSRARRRDMARLAEIISDLSGPEGFSEGQRQLARRAATISIACEKLEGAAAAGAAIDLELYGRLTDRLGRAFQRLGPGAVSMFLCVSAAQEGGCSPATIRCGSTGFWPA